MNDSPNNLNWIKKIIFNKPFVDNVNGEGSFFHIFSRHLHTDFCIPQSNYNYHLHRSHFVTSPDDRKYRQLSVKFQQSRLWESAYKILTIFWHVRQLFVRFFSCNLTPLKFIFNKTKILHFLVCQMTRDDCRNMSLDNLPMWGYS